MIKRTKYIQDLHELKDTDFVKVFVGMRRTGKTYLMLSFIDEFKKMGVPEENIIYISLESPKYYDIINYKQLDEIIYSKTKDLSDKIYILIDEIQQVDSWEKSINGYRVSLNCDIYITGSNSKLLSTELSTFLAGRYIQIPVYPFSFKEILKFYEEKGIENNYENENHFFKQYMKYGGMPGLLDLDSSDKKEKALKDIYNSIIVDDILSRHNINKLDLFKRFLRFMINSTGQTFSKKSVINYLKNEHYKIDYETLNNYTEYIQESLFVTRIRREDLIGKKELKTEDKYYLMDHGFHQALIDDNNKWIPRILETIVFNELLRRGYNIKIGKVGKKEVDFVCRKANKKLYVQVCYLLASDETIEREFSPLLKIKDNYEKYVLSMDEFDFSMDGIKHMNIIKFLKSDSII
ncbi:ATP-binding protein [Methanosphaera sp.]|uniref:ATP-binding protein n=1 Tax=Methanosphaera sp. TaxID=2666342 RepID=UPI002E760906|nr:ATP-binding protein [Methanosphaera sp.]MEE1117214.1 ATP-binding protein [Methanosphaera sp.]